MVDVSSQLTIISPARRWVTADVLTGLRRSLSVGLEKRRLYRRTLRELQSCSRRNLLDMGIDPDALHSFARRAAGL